MQPSVTLEAPRLVQQHADLFARATFRAPGAAEGEVSALVPTDATFHLRQPTGQMIAYTRTAPNVRLVDGALQLAVKALVYGDWHLRVQGTVLVGGQRVVVAAETLVHVASSPFA